MDGNLAFKEEPRYEIIGGAVVMMASPTLAHTFIAGNIYGIFRDYLRGKPCVPIQDGASLFLDKERYEPDFMVVCDSSKIQNNKGVDGAPDLVVEILSPGSIRHDRVVKREVYERYGVREYWIVSPKEMSVEQYVLENGRLVLRNAFVHYTPQMLESLDAEEQSRLVTEFRCSLFDDLPIRLCDVFERVTS